MLTNAEETINDVKIEGSLGFCDCGLVEFVIWRKKQHQDPELQGSTLETRIPRAPSHPV